LTPSLPTSLGVALDDFGGMTFQDDIPGVLTDRRWQEPLPALSTVTSDPIQQQAMAHKSAPEPQGTWSGHLPVNLVRRD